MKEKIQVFILKNCPHCLKFKQLFSQVDLNDFDVEYIDEQENKELADKFDYYYVPSVFYKNKKIHEGVIDETKIQNILMQIKK